MKILLIIALALTGCCSQQANAAPYDHIFIVLLENVGYDAIVGDVTDAPYINNTLIPQGMLYSQHYGVAHPSEPNYLALFSGSTQGVTNDDCVGTNGPFPAPNLYSRLTGAGFTIKGYMESMPTNGSLVCSAGLYDQKHNPFPFFIGVPTSAWKIYKGPHHPGANCPNFVWITPNSVDDMHDGENVHDQIHNGDVWLSANLPPLIDFCNTNNGLLILTMDEGPGTLNHIFTVLLGPRIPHGGISSETFNHYNTIKTITDNFQVPALGNSVGLEGLL